MHRGEDKNEGPSSEKTIPCGAIPFVAAVAAAAAPVIGGLTRADGTDLDSVGQAEHSHNTGYIPFELGQLSNDDKPPSLYGWTAGLEEGFHFAKWYPVQLLSGFTVPTTAVSLLLDKLNTLRPKEEKDDSIKVKEDELLLRKCAIGGNVKHGYWYTPFIILRCLTSADPGAFAGTTNHPFLKMRIEIEALRNNADTSKRTPCNLFAVYSYLPPSWKHSFDYIVKDVIPSCQFDKLATINELEKTLLHTQRCSVAPGLTFQEIIDSLQSDPCNDCIGVNLPVKMTDEQRKKEKEVVNCRKLEGKPDKAAFRFAGFMSLPSADISTPQGSLLHSHLYSDAMLRNLRKGNPLVIEEHHPCYRDLIDDTMLEFCGDEWKIRSEMKKSESDRDLEYLRITVRHWLVRLYRLKQEETHCVPCTIQSIKSGHKLLGKRVTNFGFGDPNMTCSYEPSNKTVSNPWLQNHPLRPGVYRSLLYSTSVLESANASEGLELPAIADFTKGGMDLINNAGLDEAKSSECNVELNKLVKMMGQERTSRLRPGNINVEKILANKTDNDSTYMSNMMMLQLLRGEESGNED